MMAQHRRTRQTGCRVAEAQARMMRRPTLSVRPQFEAKAIDSIRMCQARGRKISALKAKFRETQKAIDRRLAAEISAFTKRHGLTVQMAESNLWAAEITILATCL